MNIEKKYQSSRQDSGEFLEILRNRNNAGKGKAVFQRLHVYIESETVDSSELQFMDIETRIQYNKRQNHAYEVENTERLFNRIFKNEEKAECKAKCQSISNTTNEIMKKEVLQEYAVDHSIDFQTSEYPDNRNFNDVTPIEKIKTDDENISEEPNNSQAFDNNKQNMEIKDKINIAEDDSIFEISDFKIEKLETPMLKKAEENNESSQILQNNDDINLISKINNKGARNRTICDTSLIGALEKSQIDLPKPTESTINNAFEEIPANMDPIPSNTCPSFSEKIKSKRMRNRTVCFNGISLEHLSKADTEKKLLNGSEDFDNKSKEISVKNEIETENIDVQIKENIIESKTDDIAILKLEGLDLNTKKSCNNKIESIDKAHNTDLNRKITHENYPKSTNTKQKENVKNGKVLALTKEFQEFINRSKESSYCESDSLVKARMQKFETIDEIQEYFGIEKSKTKDENTLISFNFDGKHQKGVDDINVDVKESKLQINAHTEGKEEICSFDESNNSQKAIDTEQKVDNSEKEQAKKQDLMKGVNESIIDLKNLEYSNKNKLDTKKIKHHDSIEDNKNILLKGLNKRTDDCLTKFTIHELQKQIRDTGIIATIKRFFTQIFTKKWYEKKLEKLKEPDPFIISLHQHILDNFTNTPSIFRMSADKIYYTVYPEKAAKGEQIDFNLLTPHEISALYKGYFRIIFKGLISSKIGKCIVDFLKLDNLSEADKYQYLTKIAPCLVSSVERSYFKELFKLWDVIAENYKNTKMDLTSLYTVFGPSLINDSFIKDIRDSLFLPKILECFYNSDLDRVDIQFYQKFEEKCRKNGIF